MLHTPKQASGLECRSLPPVDDPTLGLMQPKCIARGCMMWRDAPLMADAAYLAAVAKYEKDANVTHAKAAAYVKDHRAEFHLPTSPTHGYCGLAGRPEA